jgi:hypothetical protein
MPIWKANQAPNCAVNRSLKPNTRQQQQQQHTPGTKLGSRPSSELQSQQLAEVQSQQQPELLTEPKDSAARRAFNQAANLVLKPSSKLASRLHTRHYPSFANLVPTLGVSLVPDPAANQVLLSRAKSRAPGRAAKIIMRQYHRETQHKTG